MVGGAGESKPEGYHSYHPPREAPPAQPPFNYTSMLLHVLRPLFQDFELLPTVVHALHIIPLL